jgi:hypothetical protein
MGKYPSTAPSKEAGNLSIFSSMYQTNINKNPLKINK